MHQKTWDVASTKQSDLMIIWVAVTKLINLRNKRLTTVPGTPYEFIYRVVKSKIEETI